MTLLVDVQREVPELASECPSSIQVPPFQDSEVMQAARKYFSDIDVINRRDVLARPIKRARLSMESNGNAKSEQSYNLVSQIFNILSIKDKTELEGLSNITLYVFLPPRLRVSKRIQGSLPESFQ